MVLEWYGTLQNVVSTLKQLKLVPEIVEQLSDVLSRAEGCQRMEVELKKTYEDAAALVNTLQLTVDGAEVSIKGELRVSSDAEFAARIAGLKARCQASGASVFDQNAGPTADL